ncbi:Scr1 family TA system antitoxin-like transcriptional regulator [Streptomyces sp. SID8358]|uniref:Scr1 family TA system antitoxin-like transcriptional regulator n=1 Tax=unclassified Streptomyces TaxID=2593676 RepID=UPI000DAEB6E9|nr:helix-turn-helix domain-containing protein [Streptomyces sp. SID8358]MYX74908.1 helix-turn-helix domain-containing protein [Streptomyces sp. SID3915]
MTEQPADVDEESGRAALGRALRYLREQSGKSLGQLAEETRYDKSYLYRLETGQRLSKLAVMEDLDRYYKSGDLLVRLWKVARREVFKDRYKEFMRLESQARIMWMYQLAVPGLLQTEDYAREVLSAARTTGNNGDLVEEQVAARMSRQEILYRDPAPQVRVILDEVALRRQPTDPKAWTDQLTHLLDTSQLPCVVLQVLPFSAGLHGLMGSHLWLMWEPNGNSVAYVEGNGFGELIDEPEKVADHRLSYDRIRDLALNPSDSMAFVRGVLKEHRP